MMRNLVQFRETHERAYPCLEHTLQAQSRQDARVWHPTTTSWLIAPLISGLIELWALIIWPETRHWFLLPLFFNGLLCSVDCVEWVRGRLNLLDPIGVMGLMGLHWFCLSPILQVGWSHDVPFALQAEDWRPWLGRMAVLNCIGLVVYYATRSVFMKRWGGSPLKTTWKINVKRSYLILCSLLTVAVATQVYVYSSYGGLTGLAEARFRSVVQHTDEMINMGGIFAVAESAPILLMLVMAIHLKARGRKPAWSTICVIIAGYFLMLLFFGGLRGSRSTILAALFWGVAIVHLWLRPVPKAAVPLGLIFILIFMHLYNYYKGGGILGVEIALDTSQSKGTLLPGKDVAKLLLGDLARADVQAYELYLLEEAAPEYPYALGRTYWGAAALIVPRQFWPGDRPAPVEKEGTELQAGVGSWTFQKSSSRCYGLGGEAMLNFGPFAVPFTFVPVAAFVVLIRRFLTQLRAFDVRLLLVPFMLYMCFGFVIGDSDNLVFSLGKEGFIPAAAVYCISNRSRRASEVTQRMTQKQWLHSVPNCSGLPTATHKRAASSLNQ